MHNNKKVLVVDLDGSLIKSDSLIESFLLLLKKNPLLCFLLPFYLLKGKAALKAWIAQQAPLDARYLPYNDDVLAYIQQQKQQGVVCYLVSGAAEKTVAAVSQHLQLFDGYFSSDNETNLTGKRKAALLHKEFGKGQYDYIGNEAVDLAVWQDAAKAIVVSHSLALVKKAENVCAEVEHIPLTKASLITYIKAIRVHQWVKNVLLFVPVLTAHQWQNPDIIFLLIAGFLSFSLAASSVYILNDLLDLAADRQHPSKRKRAFAAGDIPLLNGLLLFPVLLLLSFAMLPFLPLGFAIALFVYYLLTLSYSFYLKRIIMLDTITLALLYTMRIIAGTLLISVEFSFWLLAFSLFIFQSLALVKRYTELVLLQEQGGAKTIGRGYHAEDASMVSALGAASGYMAVLVFALYVNNPEVLSLYTTPAYLWLVCPILLYWVSRAWIIAHRGEMHDDPIVFAVRDKQSLLVGVLTLVIFWLAI